MSLNLAAYLLVGALLGILWNQAELGRRTPLRRLLPGFVAFLVAWPVLAVGVVAIAGAWTRVWRKAHAQKHPPAPEPAALPAGFADDPEPHPL